MPIRDPAGFLGDHHRTRSSEEPGNSILESAMNLRTWARILIAVSFLISGLVETLGATGLVVELSPDGRWGSGIHTLAVSGPLQLVGAALLVSGRQTRWALTILGCYVFLVSVFGNLPLIFDPAAGGSAFGGLLSNLAVLGGILYWLHSERQSYAHRAWLATPKTTRASASSFSLLACLIIMGGILYWLHGERTPSPHRARPAVSITSPALPSPGKLLV
jgi:uncharacterized membrane protein YphA (DoxX/SURF4 family)